jgi:hypothetical protein
MIIKMRTKGYERCDREEGHEKKLRKRSCEKTDIDGEA